MQQSAEVAVEFDAEHYKNGLNGDFLSPSDGLDLITKYAGGGGGGKFEDKERRDIAAAAPCIISLAVEEAKVGPRGTVLDLGAGTGLLLSGLSAAVPEGLVLASDISPDFRAWIRARSETEGLANVRVLSATESDPLPDFDGAVDLALLCDVYHHLTFPKTVMRQIRSKMTPTSRLVIIDFFRDPERVTSHPPEWVMQHLRGDQDTFRGEILSCGFELVSEPSLVELRENYIMVFRPLLTEELAEQSAKPGAGWAQNPHTDP